MAPTGIEPVTFRFKFLVIEKNRLALNHDEKPDQIGRGVSFAYSQIRQPSVIFGE